MNTTFQGNPIRLLDKLPAVGDTFPNFELTANDLSTVSLNDFRKPTVICTVPSVDTGVCSTEIKRFNQEISESGSGNVLVVSRDLPFAQKRFCESNQIKQVATLSDLRDTEFAKRIGVWIADSQIKGLMARAVFVLDASHVIRYIEVVSDVTNEPNYSAALEAHAQ